MEANAASSWWQDYRSVSVSCFYQAMLQYWYTLLLAPGLLYLVYYTLLSPIASVPGPFLAKISRLWLAYHGYKGDFHRVLVDLHAKYGDTVRIGPDEVSVADPNTVRKIYGIGSKFKKSSWYVPSHGTRKFDLFAEMREDVHRAQRRVVNSVYSIATLKELEPDIDRTIAHFMDIVRQKEGQVLDWGLWVQLFAFDVIGEVTFSKRFGMLDQGKESDTLRKIKQSQISASWVSQIPWVYYIHELLKPVIGNHLAVTARNGALRDFTVGHVKARQARRKDGQGHNDLLSKFFEIHEAKSDEFDETDVVSMAATNVVAGSDTTALALRAMFYYLLKDPTSSLKKLIEEVDVCYDKAFPGGIFPFDVANRMPYLQACMYEALRLHPAIGQTLPRVVPAEGLACGKYFVPEGMTVGTSPFVMSLSPEIFGSDAHLFRPERWLQENRGEMQRFWLPFGAGSRTCIGKNLSWMEMSKLLPTVLRHWDLRLADPNAEWGVKSYFFAIQTGLNIILQPRKDAVLNGAAL